MSERVNNKHPIHSLVTTVPVIMLLVGLYIFYRAEYRESEGLPVLAESVNYSGVYRGVSAVQSGGSGRHYLWFDKGDRTRGPRVTAGQSALLRSLDAGDPVEVYMAPHVSGSTTYWAWRVDSGDRTLFDETAEAGQ